MNTAEESKKFWDNFLKIIINQKRKDTKMKAIIYTKTKNVKMGNREV